MGRDLKKVPRVGSARAKSNNVAMMRASMNAGPAMRPLSSYGGAALPERNIKSVIHDNHASVAGQEANILRNKLTNMTVLGDNRQTSSVSKLNKEFVVNNWISDELVKFETKLELNAKRK